MIEIMEVLDAILHGLPTQEIVLDDIFNYLLQYKIFYKFSINLKFVKKSTVSYKLFFSFSKAQVNC